MLVHQRVNPEKVLVPKLFLASALHAPCRRGARARANAVAAASTAGAVAGRHVDPRGRLGAEALAAGAPGAPGATAAAARGR